MQEACLCHLEDGHLQTKKKTQTKRKNVCFGEREEKKRIGNFCATQKTVWTKEEKNSNATMSLFGCATECALTQCYIMSCYSLPTLWHSDTVSLWHSDTDVSVSLTPTSLRQPMMGWDQIVSIGSWVSDSRRIFGPTQSIFPILENGHVVGGDAIATVFYLLIGCLCSGEGMCEEKDKSSLRQRETEGREKGKQRKKEREKKRERGGGRRERGGRRGATRGER